MRGNGPQPSDNGHGGPPPGPALLGRREERQTLDRAVAAAERRGRALLLRGPAGGGKSALLDHLRAQVADGHLLDARAVAAEHDLPFASLQQLLGPVVHQLDDVLDEGDVPEGARELLRATVDGHSIPPSEDRSGPALLALFTAMIRAGEGGGPLVVLVDDVQWADGPSVAALRYVARRTGTLPLLLVVALRDPAFGRVADRPTGPGPEVLDREGFDDLHVGGLDEESAAGLLDERHPRLGPRTRREVLDRGEGLPAALLELPDLLTADQRTGLAGAAPPFGTGPVLSPLQAEIAATARQLPETTWDLLVLLAASGRRSHSLWELRRSGRSTERLLDDIDRAERHGLVRVHDDRIAFAHPLTAPTLYRTATVSRRARAHRELGAVAADVGGTADRHRAVWHRAVATFDADDQLAGDLLRAGEHAERENRFLPAAAAYERAAQVTSDAAARWTYLVAGAEQAVRGGLTGRARKLAEQAGAPDHPNPGPRHAVVRWARLTAALGLPAHDPVVAHHHLVAVAATTEPADAADEILAAAVDQAWRAGDPDLAAAAAARMSPVSSVSPGGTGSEGVPASGVADLVGEMTGTTLAAVRTVLDRGQHLAHDGPWGEDLGLLLPSPEAPPPESRPGRRYHHALQALLHGRFRSAATTANDAMDALAALGPTDPPACCLWHRGDRAHWLARLGGVVAWLAAVDGATERCRTLASGCFELAGTPRPTPVTALAHWALSLLDLGQGRYDAAADRLAELTAARRSRHLVVVRFALPDYVEAASRAGRSDETAGALAALGELSGHSSQPWLPAVLARCRALSGPQEEAEDHFRAAAAAHERDEHPFELARTRLLYGEWLRRATRRREARGHLQVAGELFDHVGAETWAERAWNELRAAGYGGHGPVEVPNPVDDLLAVLTPQERNVVRLAAEGASNREIAARLYLSPRTVGYHLYKAFPKLKVTSRRELTRLFPS